MYWDESVADKGRRSGVDRRKAQLPFAGPDRRVNERRCGSDRRSSPRHDY
ncbi:hypothetical protein AMC99_02279 [Altererythrobacter epoxidivorans]|uniref:Uncharacterized protein n=1 Tax=Altererythrobacter epoxidivorans TaxID=361183 RepID=A0A0M4LW95_9SPHN|nr:hypothetical protein [Altererythrobacter epoxidivorans]ALE17554.1 hypothetical protein AMC99_02279 [Altererythrobacter epoxidivorans]